MQRYDMVRKTITIDEDLVDDLNHFAKREERDFSSALRYALKIGLLAIENPELTVEEIKDIIEARVDFDAGRIKQIDPKDI